MTQAQLQLPSLQQLEAERCRRSLAFFVRQAWHTFEPGVDLTWNWHMQVVADHLQALYEGRLLKRRLIISVPPRSLKTSITNICFPSWQWLRDPSATIFSLSASDAILMDTSIKSHTLLESEWFKDTFKPDWKFSKKQDNNYVFLNTAMGHRKSSTIRGTIQGAGGNCLILDDISQSNDMGSQLKRDEITRLYQTVVTRMNDPRTAVMVLVAQRNHQQDLTGVLLREEADLWQELMIPLEFDPSRKCITYDRNGDIFWEDPRTEEGQLLFPERWGPEEVKNLKTGVGGLSFYSTQFQQLPVSSEGELFRKSINDRPCIAYYHPEVIPLTKFENIIFTIDPALKKGEKNDNSGILVIGATATNYWVLDNISGKYSQSELQAELVKLAAKWHPSILVVEANAHGEALIQRLEEFTNLPVHKVTKSKDKVFYANQSAVPLWESNKILLPSEAPWLSSFLDELYSFPHGVHDDQVDAMSQGLIYLSGNNSGMGFLRYLDRQEALKNDKAQTDVILMIGPPNQTSVRIKGEHIYKMDNGLFEIPADSVDPLKAAGWEVHTNEEGTD